MWKPHNRYPNGIKKTIPDQHWCIPMYRNMLVSKLCWEASSKPLISKDVVHMNLVSNMGYIKGIVTSTTLWLKWPQKCIAQPPHLSKIWTNLVVSWNVNKEEAELTPCSSSYVQWIIKFWQVMWLRNTSLVVLTNYVVDLTIASIKSAVSLSGSTTDNQSGERYTNSKVNIISMA